MTTNREPSNPNPTLHDGAPHDPPHTECQILIDRAAELVQDTFDLHPRLLPDRFRGAGRDRGEAPDHMR